MIDTKIPQKKYCLITNDVETTSILNHKLSDNTGEYVLKQGIPRLLELYSKFNVRATFYFTGHIAKLYPEIVKMIVFNGHEVASHGMSHIKSNGFSVMSLEKQILHLSESKRLLEDISDQEVVSFRAPALRTNNNTVIALEKTGFKFDSSVASQRFDMFMSFGALKKLGWFTAPRLPYRTSKKSLLKKGNSAIIEIPLSASLLPYVGTTMRIFPNITSIQRQLLSIESRMTGKPIVFDIHPNELIDESSENRIIARRSTNAIMSFLQDTVRSKLKVKNLGEAAVPIYEKQIKYFVSKGFRFTTIKDYYENIKDLI